MPYLYDTEADPAGPPITYTGGKSTLLVEGNLGGGTLTVQIRKYRSAWITWKTYTAPAVENLEAPGGLEMQADLAGATNPDLTVFLSPRQVAGG